VWEGIIVQKIEIKNIEFRGKKQNNCEIGVIIIAVGKCVAVVTAGVSGN
jgi:hypothetical protein